METLNEVLNNRYGKSNYRLEADYQKNYDEDMMFRRIANDVDLPKEILMKYTTKIEKSSCELKNCKKCKNIFECKNEVNGYVYYPQKNNEVIEFCYIPCKYKKELDRENQYKDNIYYFNISEPLKNASMALIDTKDKNRFETIKWVNDFIKNYKKGLNPKGIYLNGNFGCGKTYLLSAMLNELAKDNYKVAMVYYPEFLRTLKESFNTTDEFKNKFNYIKKVDILLLDDIGAETVTEWSRDEILGTLLQYRMEENLPTLFTSNLTIEELEKHLMSTSKDIDALKARRIIERIKQLTTNITMISENKRK
jgi:primosomal protein DnaI